MKNLLKVIVQSPKFQYLPQRILKSILDVLKCGPLSMAVLQKSEPLVRYHLQNPATIREKNAAGHSPLHLCGDWTKGIGLLLEAGFPCNVIDNSHMTPLDYTISVQGDADTTTMLLKAGSPPTRCENLHTSSSTLDRALEATLDPPVLTLGQLPLSLNKNIACLIENLKCRRESLAALAKARLPECVLSELGTLGTVIDDSRAHCTWRALEDRNVSIPTSLDTHGVSIYHQVRNKNLAKYLYDMGFKSLDEYDHRGMTPLMSLAHRLRTHNGVFENSANFDEMFDLAEWFLLQGADPLRPGRDLDVNALHVAAHGVRFRIYRETLPQEQGLIRHPPVRKILEKQWIDPVILGTNSQYDSVLSPLLLLIIEKVSPTCIDSCLCGCSLYGCTPTTVFLKGMNFFYWRYCNSMFLYEVSALLYNWYNALAAVGLTASDIRKEVERCIAFKKLGLTHTCCKPHLMVDYYGDPFNWKRFPDDDADEIREEEEELLSQLENMLQERDSEWWNSPSNLDFLLDVCSEGPPPTLRWANLWLLQRTYGIDEEACEELRRMAGIPEERFWTSPWKVPDIRGELQGWEVPKRYSKDRHKGAVKQMPRVY